jgi:hypothetical protein
LPEQDLGRFNDMIEEGEVAVAGIRVANYLDDEGRLCTTWWVDGDPSTRDMLGMLEVARFQIGAQIVVQQMGDD